MENSVILPHGSNSKKNKYKIERERESTINEENHPRPWNQEKKYNLNVTGRGILHCIFLFFFFSLFKGKGRNGPQSKL